MVNMFELLVLLFQYTLAVAFVVYLIFIAWTFIKVRQDERREQLKREIKREVKKELESQ